MINTEIVMTAIDTLTEPTVMTKREAIEFLEQCMTDIECRIEALKDELKNENEQ
jgi:hypothetical protein